MPITSWCWALGIVVLVSCCHRELVLEGSMLSLNRHISKPFFFSKCNIYDRKLG